MRRAERMFQKERKPDLCRELYKKVTAINYAPIKNFLM